MKKKWIVVAESSRARIFSVESRTTPLKELDAMVHPGTPVTEQSFGLEGHHGGRHPLESRLEPKEVETLHFAHDLGEHLETARRSGDYNDLVLISSPGFLGKLKQHLGTVTLKNISQTINKNLIHKSESEIRNYLFQ
ncbi:hypothetical protein LP43_0495 [Methylophaga thiooxydans]|uniref:Host attachment protein n=1 Tax=Methylophaga thiooxydans TaxID=392484 RepID=A0A0A0BK68_9GAMM|nr:host attachment protein [Methylophaga thiooxydans]KGM08072.1 hypothetical protein LP43_0495 [Methylophaga thiooxydans]